MKRAAPIIREVCATPEDVRRAVDAMQEFGSGDGLEDKVLCEAMTLSTKDTKQ